MAKPETAQEMITPLTDAQLLEPVKFPFGDRTVTRATFWQGPLYQIRNHHGQLVVYSADERNRAADERATVASRRSPSDRPGSGDRARFWEMALTARGPVAVRNGPVSAGLSTAGRNGLDRPPPAQHSRMAPYDAPYHTAPGKER